MSIVCCTDCLQYSPLKCKHLKNDLFIQLLRFLLLHLVMGFGKRHPLHPLTVAAHKHLLNPLVEGSPLLFPLLDVSLQDTHLLLLLLLHLSGMDIRHLPPSLFMVSSISFIKQTM